MVRPFWRHIAGTEKFPPPGGGWPRRGRERNAGGNLKVCTTLQAYFRVGHRTLEKVFGFPVIQHYRPHSSSVMEIAFGDFHDSFPPGEAIFRFAAGGSMPRPYRPLLAHRWSSGGGRRGRCRPPYGIIRNSSKACLAAVCRIKDACPRRPC